MIPYLEETWKQLNNDNILIEGPIDKIKKIPGKIKEQVKATSLTPKYHTASDHGYKDNSGSKNTYTTNNGQKGWYTRYKKDVKNQFANDFEKNLTGNDKGKYKHNKELINSYSRLPKNEKINMLHEIYPKLQPSTYSIIVNNLDAGSLDCITKRFLDLVMLPLKENKKNPNQAISENKLGQYFQKTPSSKANLDAFLTQLNTKDKNKILPESVVLKTFANPTNTLDGFWNLPRQSFLIKLNILTYILHNSKGNAQEMQNRFMYALGLNNVGSDSTTLNDSKLKNPLTLLGFYHKLKQQDGKLEDNSSSDKYKEKLKIIGTNLNGVTHNNANSKSSVLATLNKLNNLNLVSNIKKYTENVFTNYKYPNKFDTDRTDSDRVKYFINSFLKEFPKYIEKIDSDKPNGLQWFEEQLKNHGGALFYFACLFGLLDPSKFQNPFDTNQNNQQNNQQNNKSGGVDNVINTINDMTSIRGVMGGNVAEISNILKLFKNNGFNDFETNAKKLVNQANIKFEEKNCKEKNNVDALNYLTNVFFNGFKSHINGINTINKNDATWFYEQLLYHPAVLLYFCKLLNIKINTRNKS